MIMIYAHRGASKECPENTMPSFKRAKELGADGIECDAQLSLDGVPMIIHDKTLKRTTNGGKKYVKDLTFAELKQLDAGSWFSEDFKDTRIPSLEEFLVWVKPTVLLINIELKNYSLPYEGMEKKVVALIEKYGLEKRVTISSFNHESLRLIHKLNSQIETAPLYRANLYKAWKYAKKIKARALHPKYHNLDGKDIKGIKKHHVKVRPYTVNDPSWIKQFIDWGVDGLITDVPDLALAIYKKEHPVLIKAPSFLKRFWTQLMG
ncbi:glycerophosphodiester phosphodiesterase [Pseudalkalibacillus caeni]|uniref:Glycerophosphodiester phosphodiesterase n=1 Tax=Exobacillus caeni TaxID=2574798 RepID=A0A5R9EYN2_9BACL|nr:glycerophosphodiester phosphodiesterase [Pseudalkalibacillus caeni]TLS36412.1 glycerophosphodiester phosphodiesterase [Pseudalkalibacillus caeni]